MSHLLPCGDGGLTRRGARAGYAFSTYGEVAACWGQDVVLVALISRYNRSGGKRLAAGAAAFAAYCWWLSSARCSIATLRSALPPPPLPPPPSLFPLLLHARLAHTSDACSTID